MQAASRDNSTFVRIEQVSKTWGSVTAVDHLSLDVHRGEFFSLLGPSGCGKTTLLRLLAGFEQPDSGRIFIGGKDVTDIPPYERPVNMMFQSYALFPHMNVEDNIAYGLKQEHMPKAARQQRVREMLSLVQIEKLASRKPHQLSGGQRQRVALARALAKHPSLLLLDEPLAALDRKLREETRLELVRLQETLGITFIIVTHDQEEAMTLSSRIGLMRNGQLEQVDTPSRLYEYPASRYAAEFIGLANLFTLPGTTGDPVTVAVRPENIFPLADGQRADHMLHGTIRDIAYLGDMSICHVETDTGLRVKFTTRLSLQRHHPIALGWNAEHGRILER